MDKVMTVITLAAANAVSIFLLFIGYGVGANVNGGDGIAATFVSGVADVVRDIPQDLANTLS